VDDCLHEAADLDGLLNVLRDVESGKIEVVGLDTREPSPFAHEILNVMPYAFLDDAPLEERRARAVSQRRTLSTEVLRDLARLDSDAIAQVRAEAWPLVRDADELHDVLQSQGATGEYEDWRPFFDELRSAGRATVVERGAGRPFWVATERWPLVRAVWPDARAQSPVTVPAGVRSDWPREEAVAHIVRGHMEQLGPTSVPALADLLGLDPTDVEIGLVRLENQGTVLRGRFTGTADLEWCDRRLLARIHRFTLEGLRRQIAPVPPEQYVRFLVRHQHAHPATKVRDQAGLLALVEQFEGFAAPAGHWEKFLLPARMEAYNAGWLDNLTFFGQAVWGRLRPTTFVAEGGVPDGRPMKAMTRSTPITLMAREHVPWLLPDAADVAADAGLGGNAKAAYEAFVRHGALFPAQLGNLLQLVPAQVEDVLGELAAAGLVTSDGYPALRKLIGSNGGRGRRSSRAASGLPDPSAGRWTLLRSGLWPQVTTEERTEQWCRLLLRRYGVMFRDLLAGESAAPSWYELVRTYRRLEARGEVRGGRFVANVSGEQYALAEAVARLRSAADEPDVELTLPATDPLNLTGRVAAGTRVPAAPGYSVTVARGRIDGRPKAKVARASSVASFVGHPERAQEPFGVGGPGRVVLANHLQDERSVPSDVDPSHGLDALG
jgi:ATP-dependent Lhr-like helicase